jgi:hypothetical protein
MRDVATLCCAVGQKLKRRMCAFIAAIDAALMRRSIAS